VALARRFGEIRYSVDGGKSWLEAGPEGLQLLVLGVEGVDLVINLTSDSLRMMVCRDIAVAAYGPIAFRSQTLAEVVIQMIGDQWTAR
jgi:hypothetical protein